jgi:hypothetical protein
MNRSSGSAPVPKPKTDGAPKTGGSRIGEGKGGAARKIQYNQRQGQRSREAANVSKNTSTYIRQRDRGQEHKERFMQGRSRNRRGAGNPGVGGSRSPERSKK